MKSRVLLKDLRAKTTKDIIKELENCQNKIVQMQFQASFKKLKNYSQIRNERKKIARIWTILAQRAFDKLEKSEDVSSK